jgi:hypothetical protein
MELEQYYVDCNFREFLIIPETSEMNGFERKLRRAPFPGVWESE